MSGKKILNLIKELVILSLATMIVSAAIYFFLIPSKASVSSISGLAIVLVNVIPLPISLITLGLNIVLLLLGFILCGPEFGYKTVITTILLPIYLWIFEQVFPNMASLTGSDILDVASYIFFVSIGIALLFNRNASSGGLDIVAKIMNKYLHVELGRAMSISGMLVAMSSALFYPPRTVILSILGSYANGIIIDHFIFGQNIKRRVCIVSKLHMDEIRHFIVEDLHSGASLYNVEGAYTGEYHQEIITIVDKREYQLLMDYVIKTDPAAFVTVYNVSNMRYQPKIIKN